MTRVHLPDPGFHPWMTDAECTQYDPDMWFSPDGDPHTARRAKTVCQTRCTVREQCLQHALSNNEQHGIWGGMDVDERRALRRKKTA